jgi:predicted metal-dependent phosphoesterase TrpH
MLRADFHIHTHYSADSNLKPEEILKAAKTKSLDVIGVVDHGEIKGGLEVEKLAVDQKIIVFPGEEIYTKEGEIIAFGIKKRIPEGLGLIETSKIVKKQGGFLIVPHPFDTFRRGLKSSAYKIIKYIDAVEGFNARSLFSKFNEKAKTFAKENDLPIIAGSDAHFANEIGTGITLINSKPNKPGIINAIKNKNVEITGKKTGVKPHLDTFFQKFRG